MNLKRPVSRRSVLKSFGAVGGALVAIGAGEQSAGAAQTAIRPPKPISSSSARKKLFEQVFSTALVDTHEHLPEEKQRLAGGGVGRAKCDDWALLLSHYLDSDLLVAGMPPATMEKFMSSQVDPVAKWELLAPWWPAVKNTGYGQAVRIAIRELYDVDELSAATVKKVQAGYEKVRRPGFYQDLLRDRARLESCQVNCITGEPFKESAMPTFLMQDIGIVGMFSGPGLRSYAPPTGIDVKSLADWHNVIKWWFDKYAKYAVAVKSQNAYSRDIDYERVSAEQAEAPFKKMLAKESVSAEERKRVEDHLFWVAVEQATAHELPVKLHTGYYAGQNGMPLSRLRFNAGSACELCRRSPDTRFVFMHICYPHYEELLALAKHYSNAHVDMCWSWLINPVAAKDYLKKHIVTAPANKLLPFGGDYIPVEPVVGHAVIARRGIALALSELVEEGWLTLGNAMELIPTVMNGNARRIFALPKKTEALAQAPWLK